MDLKTEASRGRWWIQFQKAQSSEFLEQFFQETPEFKAPGDSKARASVVTGCNVNSSGAEVA